MVAKSLLKRGILLAGILGFVLLVFGPTFVAPVDHQTGIPYHELPADHPDYVAPRAAQKVLGVFMLAFAMWVTAPIPLPATSVLALALLPVLGILPAATDEFICQWLID